MTGKKGKSKRKGVTAKTERPDQERSSTPKHDSKHAQHTSSGKRMIFGKKTQSNHQRSISKNIKVKNNGKKAKLNEEKRAETREPSSPDKLTSAEVSKRRDGVSVSPTVSLPIQTPMTIKRLL